MIVQSVHRYLHRSSAMLAETISLRFGVGTRVECNCGEWKEGTVVKHYYAQKSFAPGTCMPYLIRLTDGKYIFAPRDVDDVIRLPINIQLITPSETEMPAEVVGPDFGGSGNAAHDSSKQVNSDGPMVRSDITLGFLGSPNVDCAEEVEQPIEHRWMPSPGASFSSRAPTPQESSIPAPAPNQNSLDSIIQQFEVCSCDDCCQFIGQGKLPVDPWEGALLRHRQKRMRA